MRNSHDGLYDYVKSCDPGFIDAATDPFPEKELAIIVSQNNLHTIAPVLTADINVAQRHRDLNFLYYPIWLVSAIQSYQNQCNAIKQTRTQYLSCLNRQPRLHRFLTYYLLSQQPWFDQVHSSFAGLDCNLGACGDVVSLDQLIVLGEVVKNYFDQHQKQFPVTSDTGYAWNNCHDSTVPAYQDCWANLATETSVHVFCITEKTTKPLVAGTLFFPVASQQFVDKLSSMGFDMNYTGIDYSFDQEPTWQLRVQKCVNEISRIYYDLEEIWHANAHRIKHNSDLFASADLLNYCFQDVTQYV